MAKRPEQVGFFLADWNEQQELFSVRTWHPLAAKDLEFRSDFAEVDVVFGCLDNDLSRLVPTEICARLARPYFDLVTDT